MLQVYPERSAGFYDLQLYQDADIFITTSAIESRYRREPARFSAQLAFYDNIESACMKLATFSVPDGSKPTIAIYGVPGRRAPFAGRRDIRGPQPLRTSTLSGVEALFYRNLGVNYEAFRFYEEAIRSYDLALGFIALNPSWYLESALGRARCLVALGRKSDAVSFLTAAAERAPTPAIREHVLRVGRSLR
jgi:tetratricopeptide (TPR) repeat protein